MNEFFYILGPCKKLDLRHLGAVRDIECLILFVVQVVTQGLQVTQTQPSTQTQCLPTLLSSGLKELNAVLMMLPFSCQQGSC